jgi:hypothetical protein
MGASETARIIVHQQNSQRETYIGNGIKDCSNSGLGTNLGSVKPFCHCRDKIRLSEGFHVRLFATKASVFWMAKAKTARITRESLIVKV